MLEEVAVAPVPLDRFRDVISDGQWEALQRAAEEAVRLFDGRTLWTVNSTARGGGVAEMLQVLLSYARGAGVDAKWVIAAGDPAFFSITKRLHNRLHGSPGDGGPLGAAEQQDYRERCEDNADQLIGQGLRAGDIVLLHDPQTAGMLAPLRAAGATVVWRCHVGSDDMSDRVVTGWEFLRPFLGAAHRHVFTRAAFVPSWLDPDLVSFIPPSIDPFSAKNRDMSDEDVVEILVAVGLLEGTGGGDGRFLRRDGSSGRVARRLMFVRGTAPLHPDVPLVVQVSRWDHLKDMAGVMRAFTEDLRSNRARLALVGPDVSGVTDDPEGVQVLEECVAAWDALPSDVRRRVLLVSVPMEDVDENAAIVNALQRHATVVVQKSLAEGFGLTVTEAMWKAKPVVASPVGGIRDQIVNGRNGILLPAADDRAALGAALDRLLEHPAEAARLGAAARRDVIENRLGDRHLVRWIEVLQQVQTEAG